MARGLTVRPRGAAAAAGGLAARFPALQHVYFRRYIAGQGISLIGFWMQAVAQSWLVYRLSASAFALGVVASAAYLPVLCLAPVAGVVADRVDRHRLVVLTQTLAMLLALGLGTLVALGVATVPIVAGFALGLGMVGAFDLPTRQAFLVQMVGAEDLPSAIAMNASVFNAARVIGPALAGTLVASIGEAPCFFLNAASYLAVIGALLTMRFPRAAGRGAAAPRRGELRSGVRYVRAHPPLGALLLALGVVSGLALQFGVLLPVVAERRFGAGASGYGMLLTAVGVGAVCSALELASRRPDAATHRRHLLGGLVAFGLGLLGLAASPRLAAALACNVVAGFGLIRFTATTNTLLQLLVDDGYRGRVMGLHTVMFMGTSPAGSLLLGALAERFGAVPALIVSAAAPLAAAAWLIPRLSLARLERGGP